MKAITIHQPYAELIARGEKRVENRTWATKHRGLIAIHAGNSQQWLRVAEREGLIRPGDSFDMGAIVAVAEITHCLTLTSARQRHFDELDWLADHAHVHGPFCWVLDNVRRLATPLSCRGRQQLWTVPADIERDINRQLRARQAKA